MRNELFVTPKNHLKYQRNTISLLGKNVSKLNTTFEKPFKLSLKRFFGSPAAEHYLLRM